MSDTTQDAEGANKPMTLAKQVADAQRVVRSWSPDKRANVQLEGGLLNPRSYAAIRQAMGDDAAGVAPAAPTLLQTTVLRDVVRGLRETGRYVDEEGEATDALEALALTLGTPGVAPADDAQWENDAARALAQFIHLSATPEAEEWAKVAVFATRLLNAPGVKGDE